MDAPLSWTSAPPRLDAPPPHAPPSHALPDMVVRRSPTGFALCDPLLEALVGAPALPLPFTPLAAPDEVVAHLRRNNPTRLVRFDPDPLGDSSPATHASAPASRTDR